MSYPLSGFRARGTLGGTPYLFAEVRITPTAEDLDITNSEGLYGDNADLGGPEPDIDAAVPGKYQGSLEGPSVVEVMIRQATLDWEAKPWSAPYNVRQGARIGPLIIWPVDMNVESPWYFGCLQVRELPHNIVTRGLQEISFTAKSVGKFWLPDEAGNPGG